MYRIIFLVIFMFLMINSATATDSYVNAGETVSNGSVRLGDTQYVYGVTNFYVIDGNQVIGSGGVSNTSIIYPFSVQTVLAGGTSNDTKLFGFAVQDVYGTARNTLSASQGVINLRAGGQLAGTTTLNGGILNIFESGVSIPTLQMSNGIVNLVPESGQVNINTLAGNGQFSLRSNFGKNTQQAIKVNSSNGNYGLSIIDSSPDTILPVRINLIEKNQNNAANFYLNGNAVDVGAYQYTLAENNDGWYLERSLNKTDTSIIAKNTYTSLNSVFYAHFQNLKTRMGEIRSSPKNSGFWIRGLSRKLDLDFQDDTTSKIDIFGFQTGFDIPLKQNVFNRWLVGIDYGYSKAHQKYDRSSDSHGNTNSLGLYSTIIMDNNIYLDLNANYYWHNQKTTSYLPIAYPVKSDYNVNAMGFSIETGKRWVFGDRYFIEPQFQLKYITTDNVTYRTSQNTLVKGKDSDSALGRIGFLLGKKFSEDSEVFINNSLMHEFDGKSKISVADFTFNEELSGTFYQIGIGINSNLDDRWQIYGGVTTLIGDDISMPFDFNIGLRYEL